MSTDCSLGLLTTAESPNCLTPLSNDILCGIELCIGLLIVCGMGIGLPYVNLSLRIMLILYMICLLSVCVMCCVALAHIDEKTNVHYVLWTIAHVCYAFGIATRMHVFVRVVYNASRQKSQFNMFAFSISIYANATLFSLIIFILWFPLYGDISLLVLGQLKRAGFIMFGLFTMIMSISLFFVSRFVIGFYVGLVDNPDSNEKRRREKGATILKHMTGATCGALFFSSINYFIIGGINGALRNEVAHAQFWLVEIAMLPLIRFIRQCAEVRAEHERTRKVKTDDVNSSSGVGSSDPNSVISTASMVTKLTAVQIAEQQADSTATQLEDDRV